jgi:hypothetical protein
MGSMDRTPLFEERERALEEVFFRKREAELIEELRSQRARKEAREALARASGIQNQDLLDRLLDYGVRAESLVALALAPLVAVAWADRSMQQTERYEILERAEDLGVDREGPSYGLLRQWLEERPAPALFDAWRAYAETLGEALDPRDRKELGEELLGQARAVARAAGGVLGLPPKTSPEEREVLRAIEDCFRG